MPRYVIGNVVDSRLLVNNNVVEDVQKVQPPDLEKVKTEIDAMGLAGKFDLATTTRFEKMTVSIEHNRGHNYKRLRKDGIIDVECRLAIQRYTVSKAEMGYIGTKYRFRLQHIKTSPGGIERDNPHGFTEEYSCLRYEEIVNGEVVNMVDILTGEVILNGVNQSDPIKALLD